MIPNNLTPSIFIAAFCSLFLFGCNSNSVESETVAQLNDKFTITFAELESYHSGRFFERRFPDAELYAYPIALDELIVKELKLIDFFESDLHKDSVLLKDLRRTINDEILQQYFENVVLESFVEKNEDQGTQEELRNEYINEALERFDEIKVEQVDKESVDWNTEGLAQITQWANTPDFFNSRYRTIINEEIEDGNNFIILTYPKGIVNLKQYLLLLNNVLILEDNSSPTISTMQGFVLEALRTKLLLDKAKEANSEDKILSFNTPSLLLKDRYIRLYNQVNIFNQIPELNQRNIKDFYNSQKDSSLYQLAKRNIYVSSYNSLETAEEAYKNIQEGQSFEEVTNQSWKNKSYIKNRNGEIESYLSIEKPYLGEQAFALSQNEISEPVEYQHPEKGTQYAIIKCALALEEKVPALDEVENIERKFTEFYRIRLTQKVENTLFDKYPVKRFTNNLKEQISKKKE